MMPVSRELINDLLFFKREEGEAALIKLAEALEYYYSNQCTLTDGTELYRNQGAAQLAKWIKRLPEGLKNEHNAAFR